MDEGCYPTWGDLGAERKKFANRFKPLTKIGILRTMDAIIILNDDTVMHVVILDSDPSQEELNEMVKFFRGNRYICATMDHASDFGSLKALYEEL